MILQERERNASGESGPHSEEDARWLESEEEGGGDEYSATRHGKLVSACRPVPELPFERFLESAAGQERFFWRDGEAGHHLCGGWGGCPFNRLRQQPDCRHKATGRRDFLFSGNPILASSPKGRPIGPGATPTVRRLRFSRGLCARPNLDRLPPRPLHPAPLPVCNAGGPQLAHNQRLTDS